jgi:hypothetical protein
LAFRDAPPDRVIVWWPRSGGHGVDVDVDGIERRAVVVLGHVDSQGGSRENLRAAVDQRADRFFLQNIPTPPLHQAGRLSRPIAGRLGVRAGVRGVHGDDRLGRIAPCRVRLGRDRNACQSCHSLARAEIGSPPPFCSVPPGV